MKENKENEKKPRESVKKPKKNKNQNNKSLINGFEMIKGSF